ncbi:MAG TPA: response regulator transcription factor [Alphaproteobacteria bacterium]|nr:response regulator transcription factor [Alphaproteobacteria bacterium]
MEVASVIGPASLFRSGLVSVLAAIGFSRVEAAETIEELKRRFDGGIFPGLFVITLSSSQVPIIQITEDIRATSPNANIVFLADRLDFEDLCACFSVGASGYLLKDISPLALEESLHLIQAGEKVFPSQLASLFPALVAEQSRLNVIFPATADLDLSSREVEILACLAHGQSNKVIARNLAIAEATVKVHIKRILRKAKVTNRTQAALWGLSRGLAGAPVRRGLVGEPAGQRAALGATDAHLGLAGYGD